MTDSTPARQETKATKQNRKMTRILTKAWGLVNAEPFHDHPGSTTEQPLGLKTIGMNLDNAIYEERKVGWDKFASHLGGVYNFRITSNVPAKENLQQVMTFLSKIDPNLASIASKSCPQLRNSSKQKSHLQAVKKKRKVSPPTNMTMNDSVHVPKKKKANRDDDAMMHTNEKGGGEASLTLSQREDLVMEELQSFVEQCGGAREQVNNFRVRIKQQSSGQYDTTYFSPQGRKLRSKAEVAKFLNLRVESFSKSGEGNRPLKNNSSLSFSQSQSQGGGLPELLKKKKPRTVREADSERKKLRRELEKLHKAHYKATKALDEVQNEYRLDLLDDTYLEQREENKCSVLDNGNCHSFLGIPPQYTPVVLQVWDFLHTFCGVLSLDPIGLDDFTAAIVFNPKENTDGLVDGKTTWFKSANAPVYLGEAHLSLLKLVLNDKTSDDWWWSTLESDNDGMMEGTNQNTNNTNDEIIKESSFLKNKKTENMAQPIIKVDLTPLFAFQEDFTTTTRWLQALEDVRPRKMNSGEPIKRATKSAMRITNNPFVKSYLSKALRKYKKDAAGCTKRAVVWLIDKVREARPDLWGRKVSQEALQEQARKVAKEAAAVMDTMAEEEEEEIGSGEVEDKDDNDEDDYESSCEDDEEEEEDDDNSDEEYTEEEEEEEESKESKKTKLPISQGQVNKFTQMISSSTSAIPLKPLPTLTDLLLPPNKPEAHLLTPLTWPCLVGTCCQRILHRYKQKRNEVDDDIRKYKELAPITTSAERRRREAIAPLRIFGSAYINDDSNHDHNVKFINPMEEAIEHLCSGKPYLDLSPVRKLFLLKVLIEAAYDTIRVTQCVEDNFQSRINAEKALEIEIKRAKKEAKEEAATEGKEARNRLVQDSKDFFVQNKRQEIIRHNMHTREYTHEFIAGLTDDDIAEFDEETKILFDALPSFRSFSKADVTSMVAKINEESAFETNSLSVLTMEEIEAREETQFLAMQKELHDCIPNNNNGEHTDSHSDSHADKIEKLQKHIANHTEITHTLQQARIKAVDALTNVVMEGGTIKSLRAVIKSAKIAKLCGITDHDPNCGIWAHDLLRDAALELKIAEKKKRVTEAQKDLVAKRNKCFTRTEPLGRDRRWNAFWHFDSQNCSRVWVEGSNQTSVVNTNTNTSTKTVTNSATGIDSMQVCQEEMDLITDDTDFEYLSFIQKEHLNKIKQYWGCFVESDKNLREFIKNLHEKGERESALKVALKELFEAGGTHTHQGHQPLTNYNDDNNNDDDNHNHNIHGVQINDSTEDDIIFYPNGDEVALSRAVLLWTETNSEQCDVEMIQNITSAMGHSVRLRRVPDYDTPWIATYEMGTISGWANTNTQQPHFDDTQKVITHHKHYVWQLTLDSGDKVNLSSEDLIQGILCSKKWATQQKGYFEYDASFLSYRNIAGKFYGGPSIAAGSSTPSSFAKLMIKREMEYYTPIKNRSHENNWGGKEGARNSWIASLKEYGQEFTTVKDAFLTLENAFFELSGKFTRNASNEQNHSNSLDGKKLLEDEKYRVDIELYSITGVVSGLWNSPQTRAIFLEIIQSCNTVGFLTLGLELLCQNCNEFLQANAAFARAAAYTAPRTTRSQNAWQLANQY